MESGKLRLIFRYRQTLLNILNHALLPLNECLRCGGIFAYVLVNPCNNHKHLNIYIHLFGRHYSKHFACVNSFHSYSYSSNHVPFSPYSNGRH